jgi:hypothetical protein
MRMRRKTASSGFLPFRVTASVPSCSSRVVGTEKTWILLITSRMLLIQIGMTAVFALPAIQYGFLPSSLSILGIHKVQVLLLGRQEIPLAGDIMEVSFFLLRFYLSLILFNSDFLNGWDVDILQEAMDQCTNASGVLEDCGVFTSKKLIQDDSVGDACRLKDEAGIVGTFSKLPGSNPISATATAMAPASNSTATANTTTANVPVATINSTVPVTSADSYVPVNNTASNEVLAPQTEVTSKTSRCRQKGT